MCSIFFVLGIHLKVVNYVQESYLGLRAGEWDQRRGEMTDPLIALRAHDELSGSDGGESSLRSEGHTGRRMGKLQTKENNKDREK